MKRLRWVRWFICPLLLAAMAPAEDLGISVPPGFEVSLYADDALAHDIYSMTVDAQGRVVVAGAGYVKILHDEDGDGRADRASLFSKVPASGAHGMCFDGRDLICTGDNAVLRLRDADGDDQADGPGEAWTALRHPEHGANGLVRGPDGCYYLIGGNDSGIGEKQITTDTSPVKHPRCGGVVRFSAEGKPLDVYAHGFRNPYDLDFDADGHLLTVDSDGERDHHLPWYAPTRLFDVAQGAEHGWLLQGWMRGWNRPQSFFDNVERMVEIGRGSPTGLVVYRHHAFPQAYRGGVFSACWTLGRVYYFPLEPAGASCSSKLETFMQTTGDTGFAPCDLAVGPRGDLYVAIGGRHTRGSVFRVRWTGKVEEPVRSTPLAQVLDADQPLASWSRAAWVPKAKALGATTFHKAAADESLSAAQRVRAVEILVELFDGLDPEPVARWVQASQPRVRARVAWALGRGPRTARSESVLAKLTADNEPRVARAAWEALAMLGPLDADAATQPDWARGLTSPVRRVRAASIALARSGGQASYRKFQEFANTGGAPKAVWLAELWIKLLDDSSEKQRPAVSADDLKTLVIFNSADVDRATRLEAIRLLQISLGDLRVQEGKAEVYSGYLGNTVADVDPGTRSVAIRVLAKAFPSASPELDREVARTLGMLGADNPAILPALAQKWNDQSTVEDDLHYLIVASLLPTPRTPEVTAATAKGLLGLHKKLDDLGQFPSRNWPFRVSEAFDELQARDAALATALVNDKTFGHAGHALFVQRIPKDLRPQATRRLWQAMLAEEREPTAELVALVGRLPAAEAAALLEPQWEHVGLRDSIILALAKNPREQDRARFVEALASPQPEVVEQATRALLGLGIACTPAEMAQALRALKQACGLVKRDEPRDSLIRLLEFWTEGDADVDLDPDPAKIYIPWYAMFEEFYPQEAALLKSKSGSDLESWRSRLAKIDWTAGDVGRGRAVFERRTCHRCHEQSGHLGPELKGAVARMSRDDLFAAIVDPNLEVSPTYQTTVIATNAGQVYHGVIVYESPEGSLLQTGPDTTVRILDTEKSSLRKSMQSLMPTGLLETLTDQDLGDLYAYLQTLGKK